MRNKTKTSERTPGRAAEHTHSADDAAPARNPDQQQTGSGAGATTAAGGAATTATATATPISPRAWSSKKPAAPRAAAAAAAAPAGDDEAAAAGGERGGGLVARAPPRPNTKDGHVLHPDLINPNIIKTQYAVRGELYLRAEELRRQGREITFTNIGNPHNLGAKPKTFTRDVIALCAAPRLLDDPATADAFPADAAARARRLLGGFSGGIGAYSDSRGALGVREEVARFIGRRDGHPANAENIFLTDGASPAVRMVLQALIRDGDDAIMCPIPQYPLYSAAIQLLGGSLVPYPLDESDGWALHVSDLRAAAARARQGGKCVRALVFINPGNPTGQVLSEANLRELVRFAQEEGVVLMADEVYQELVYREDRPFVSARKVLYDMGEPYASSVELVSFHTVSKGTSGECGLRGGYYEMVNILPGTVAELYKMSSINLSPNSVGQIALSCMVNPPQPGDPSYATWAQETAAELASLKRRAALVTAAFDALPGAGCSPTDGAMYAFPRLQLPRKAIEAARAAGKAPDAFYCLKLLDETGIVTVPGCGFGQAPGTLHLRTTILPREEVMAKMVERLGAFHRAFMDEYADD